MFNDLNFDDIFGAIIPNVEEDKEDKKNKAEVKVSEPVSIEADNKTSSAKKTVKKSNKSSQKVTKDELLNGIINIVTPYSNYVIGKEGTDIKTSEIINYVANDLGYTELKSKYRDLVVSKDRTSVFLAQTLNAAPTPPNTIISFGKNGDLPVTVAIGFEQETYTKDKYTNIYNSGLEASLKDVIDSFTEIYPIYKTCSFVYDPESNIITLSGKDAANNIALSFPISIIGDQEYFEADLELKTIDSLKKLYLKNTELTNISCSFNKLYSTDGTVFLPIFISSSSIAPHDNSLFVVQENVKLNTAKESYKVPLTIYTPFGATISVTADMVKGVRATKTELISIAAEKYSMYNQYDAFGQKNTVLLSYVPENDIVYITSFSGTKGNGSIVRKETLRYGDFYLNNNELIFNYTHTKIPYCLLDKTISFFREQSPNESIVQIWYDISKQKFMLIRPNIVSSDAVSVSYNLDNHTELLCNKDYILIITLHSHNSYPPIFSEKDDIDDCYTGIFGVIGSMDHGENSCKISIRAGMERNFTYINLFDLFELPETKRALIM